MTATEKIALLVVAVVVLAALIATPALIALVRRHPERRLIYKLSPLSTFSFILWGALIVWAASDQRNDGIVSKYVERLRANNRLPWVIVALLALGVVGSLVTFLGRA